jgi:hypothetical protein
MFCREKIANKSWLEVTLAEKSSGAPNVWDIAHQIADRIKNELKADVFVEPAGLVGRHHQLTTVKSPNSFGGSEPVASDPFSGLMPGGRGNRQARSMFGADAFGMNLPGVQIPGMNNVPGMPNMPGMFGQSSQNGMGIPDANDFLPAHVREALSMGESRTDEEKCLALRAIAAFESLPESVQQMFEVETIQALQAHRSVYKEIMPTFAVGDSSGVELASLATSGTISKRLKQFLSDNLI